MMNKLAQAALDRSYLSLYALGQHLTTGDSMTTEFFYDELKGFDSTAIDLAGYDSVEGQLYIKFTSGGEIIYMDVPYATWTALLDAPSAGGFYNEVIAKAAFSSYKGDDIVLRANPNPVVPEDADERETPKLDALVAAQPVWYGDVADEEKVVTEQSIAQAYVPVDLGELEYKGDTHFGSGVEGANRVAGNLVAALEDEEDAIFTPSYVRYGIKYSFGDAGLSGYYEAHANSDNSALLAFYGAIEEAEALLPGVVTKVKVKELTRYFD